VNVTAALAVIAKSTAFFRKIVILESNQSAFTASA
jgi:hypothetical protein